MEGYHHLTLEERALASAYRKDGRSIRWIARYINRSPSTLSRELRRNLTMGNKYDAMKAHKMATRRTRGRPEKKIKEGTAEYEYVKEGFMNGWSCEQIAGRYEMEYPGKKLSHETIYRYLQATGSEQAGAKKYVTWQRVNRRKRGKRRKKDAGGIPNRTGIELRPAKANDRSEFGHWEGDLMCFGKRRDVVLHVVERKTRVGMAQLLTSKNSKQACKALVELLGKVKAKYSDAVKSVTFDNGKEFALHTMLNDELDVKTYFCHPYTSCEKGTVENSNGILRRYLPRNTDPDGLPQSELKDIRLEMNNRPLKVLGWITPLEAFKLELELLQSNSSHPVALHL